ncbi:type II secretion system F family protein [Thalassomonas sp. M1454]|uniref:type II secretion system F family protein n=1 Tax=Thalassomonas sp. M1454 TaxID=2594477 RepID=UPI00117CA981|nr:type II secretion system F family protein [Thalassomonas sp. M1454]TRX54436.1 type II secretion system F family protein [Thalassomonas sp. M1454]
MDYLLGLVNSVIDSPEGAKWAIYFIAGAAGITLAIAMSLVFSGTYSPIRMKLQKMQGESNKAEQVSDNISQALEHSLDKMPFLQQSFAGDDKTKRLLIHSGFHSENALKIYNAIKLFLLLIGGSIAIMALQAFPDLSSFVTIYLVAIILGGSYLLPGFILTYIAKRRMLNLRKFFPDALDLLVVCCESGLGLLDSFQRVSKEMEYAQPALSHELALVCSKVRVGFSMQDALHEFSERTGLEDIRGLNSVIVQSLRLGTGIASTLRIYSEEYRDKRLQEAEEKAAKVGVKMVFPMMCCIWPSFFIVAVGPAVLKVMAVWDTTF